MLVKEPFCLTPAQIANLTPYQVRHIFFRQKDETPSELPWFMQNGGKDAKGTPVDKEKDLFWKVNKEWRNLSEEQVQKLWDKHLASRNQKKSRSVKKNGPLKT